MKKTIILTYLFVLMILLSGCATTLSGAAAASSTPTIVLLPTVTETPLPTAFLPPSPSPTPAPATTSPAQPSPTPTAMVATPSAAASQSAEASVAKPAATKASLSGTWDFTFGTMSLTQRDMTIKGAYQWYSGADTGRVEGVVVDDLAQFQGVWISDRSPNSQGLLRWQLAADWASFSGSFEGSRTGQWCGVRSGQPLPSGCGFSGVWQLRFGSPPGLTGQATLVQTGQTVRGTFVDSEGHTDEIVDGVITVQSITEAKLTGVWRNDQGEQDSFEWRLDLTTGQTFQGRRDPGNSEWCGWRQGANEPEQCGWED